MTSILRELKGPIVRIVASENDSPINPSNIRLLRPSPDHACSFTHFLAALGNPPQALAGGPPQTIRAIVGSRQFGDFAAVLMTEKPASADLSDRVRRWRGMEAGGSTVRGIDYVPDDDLPLRAHPDQAAEGCRLRFAIAVTTGTIGGWIIIGIIAAAIAG